MKAVDGSKELLASHPYVDAVSDKPGFAEGRYREHLAHNYVIVYKVIEDEVVFLRFFHQTQLYQRFVMEWE